MKSFSRPQALSVLSHVMISFLLLGSGIALNSPVANAQNGPVASKIAVRLTMEPSPAQKGSNTVRVKLTDSAGQPITGAEVTATFFMPAMPAMNMAAMKTVIKGANKGRRNVRRQGRPGFRWPLACHNHSATKRASHRHQETHSSSDGRNVSHI